MRTIRAKETIKGVEVEMLFTPRLFTFRTQGMDFSLTTPIDVANVTAVYADLMYCAALNMWTLNDRLVEDYPLTRADFHEWSVLEPKNFGRTMRIALEAITNKSMEELLSNDNKSNQSEDIKKKTSRSIIQRLRDFWSGS